MAQVCIALSMPLSLQEVAFSTAHTTMTANKRHFSRDKGTVQLRGKGETPQKLRRKKTGPALVTLIIYHGGGDLRYCLCYPSVATC